MAEIFGAEEYQGRLQRLRSALDAAEIDALLLTSPADIFYMSGFLTRFWESPARPWFLVIPATGTPVAVIPTIGAKLMQQSWIGELLTWDAPDPRDDGVSLLADTISGLVPQNGTLGLPMGLETQLRMPLGDYHRLARTLSPRQIVDATAPLQRTREIKSKAEIGKIRKICAIAGRAFETMPEIAEPGRSLSDVFRAFQAELLHQGADWVSYLAGAAGPSGYDDVIAPANDAALAPGDVVMLDTGAVKDGYFCDFDRNLFLGPQSDDVRRAHAALWHATEDTLAALRPGMRASDAHRLLSDGLRRHGAEPCGGRLGHGLGLSLTEWPSFTPLDHTELRANMVLTLEPSAYTQGGRFLTHEENIVLREDGAELLAPRAPLEPDI